MLFQVQVGGIPNGSLGDNSQPTMLAGKAGEGVVTELHGKYYTQTYRGNLWSANLVTPSAIPASATNATPNFIIWNPAGNNTNVVFTRLNIGFAAGTGIAGQIGYWFLPQAGSGLATAGAMSAFTDVSSTQIQPGILGKRYGGSIRFGTAATVTGTGQSVPTLAKWASLSQGAPITTTAAMYNLWEDFDGTFILPPNTALYLAANAAIAETSGITMTAYEAPL